MAQTFFPVDPIECTPGTANSWQNVDLDTYVAGLGSDVTGVLLHCVCKSSSWKYLGLRKNGSTDDRYSYFGAYTHNWVAIGVDSDHIFQAYVGSATSVDIFIVGYTKTGVTFFDNAYDKTPTEYLDWIDMDCHVEAPNAVGLIFEIFIDDGANYHYVGLRKKGSTDLWQELSRGHDTFGFIIGCDTNQVCQGHINDLPPPAIKFYLVGYITDGATFNTNFTDVSISAGQYPTDWLDLPALPSNSVMGFITVYSVAGTRYAHFGLRTNGSSEDIFYLTPSLTGAIVGCDASYIIEGKIEVSTIYFKLVGYAWSIAPPVAVGRSFGYVIG